MIITGENKCFTGDDSARSTWQALADAGQWV